jgi:hypothetical protein
MTVVLITGALTGIGRATALAFAAAKSASDPKRTLSRCPLGEFSLDSGYRSP